MPNKFLNHKEIEIKKQEYKLSNWSEYNKALKRRGDIEIWLCQEVIDGWLHEDRRYDGTGTPDFYTDLAIITCHEIRKVFRLPLRQCEGFINSLFRIKGLPIRCPSFSDLSKRSAKLQIKSPRYRETGHPEDDLVAIAIDSTGLKRFGRDEWHQEKHQVLAKRSWRKLHIAVYKILSDQSPKADIIIPPRKDAVYHDNNHEKRNQNILEIEFGYGGRMGWQNRRH